jgi:hypothetical protein
MGKTTTPGPGRKKAESRWRQGVSEWQGFVAACNLLLHTSTSTRRVLQDCKERVSVFKARTNPHDIMCLCHVTAYRTPCSCSPGPSKLISTTLPLESAMIFSS